MINVKDQELVSVIIPVYNGSQYISYTLDSVLNQTYPAIEIIVINDGSTDDTKAVLERYADKIIVIDQKNSGQSTARNHGIAKANGKYIALLDSDDVFLDTKIEKQMSLIRHSDLDIVCTGFHTIDKKGTILSEVKLPLIDTVNALKQFLKGNFICTSTMLFKKDVFNAVEGFDTSLKAAEDGDLWFRMLLNGARLGGINEALLKYRVHSGNYSGNFLRMLRSREQAHQKQYQLLMDKKMLEAPADKLFLSKCFADQLSFASAVKVLDEMEPSLLPFEYKIKRAMYSFLSSSIGQKVLGFTKQLKSIVKG